MTGKPKSQSKLRDKEFLRRTQREVEVEAEVEQGCPLKGG